MDLWLEILQWAVHTPSPHNVQPWKFKLIDPHNAFLFIDRARMLPKEDLTGSFLLSAMTMMVESISMLAANRGYRLEVKPLYEGQDLPLIPFAELKLGKDPNVRAEYPDPLFTSRRTSRLVYEDKPLPAGELQELVKFTAGQGQVFGYSQDPLLIEQALSWNIEALFHDLNETDYHAEISEYFRCSDVETAHHRDGLDFRCMNLGRSELWICKRAPFLLQVPGFKGFMKWMYRRRLGPVGCIGWLSGPFWSQEEGLAAGKPLIRFWMETARRGIYFHPLGNLVTNKEAFQKTSGQFRDEKIWLVFKMGYSKEPPLSARLPVSAILI